MGSKHEDTLAPMRRADVRRAKTAPLRIEPERGQLLSKKREGTLESGHVLHDDDSGSRVAYNADELGAKLSGVVSPLLLPGKAPWLARDPRDNGINSTTQRGSVEVSEITAPNRRWLHGLVFHPRQEHGRGVGVPLDAGHHTGSGPGCAGSQLEPTNAGAQTEDAG